MLLETAQAQEEAEYSYPDLVMLYERTPEGLPGTAYRVRNAGNATAVGVIVSFHLENLQLSSGIDDPPDKKTVHCANQELTCQEFTYSLGDIPPGETSSGLKFVVVLHEDREAGTVGTINATASSVTPEPKATLASNIIRHFMFGGLQMHGSSLALLLSVDDLRPEEGGNVNFSLTATNRNSSSKLTYLRLIADARVKVELSDGLRFKDGWTPPTTFVKSGNLNQSATWSPPDTDTLSTTLDPTLGGLFEQSHDIVIETQLTPGVSLEERPLEERCITARVEQSIPPPNPVYVLRSLKQCLGDDPQIMFKDGEIDLLYLYPCATATTIAYPCRDDNSDNTVDNGLELVVLSDVTRQFAPRAQGLGRRDSDANELYLRPEDVVVRVDPEARVGTKWYSGSDENSDANDAGLIPGALLHLDFLGADWKPYTFAVSDVSPKKRPGTMEIFRMDNTGFELLDADTKTSLGPVNSNLDVIPLVAVFGTLGTYEVNLTMGGTNSSTAYTSSGRYTFHVGPIAELEVRDGGASHHASAGQNALTIVAANNGPDDSLGAKVTNLPAGREVLYKSQGDLRSRPPESGTLAN